MVKSNTATTKISKDFIFTVLAFICGINLTFAAVHIIKEQRIHAKELLFSHKVEKINDSLSKAIAVKIEKLRSIQNFYYSSNFVDNEEFNTFTQDLTNRNTYIDSLTWLPKISDEARDTYEQSFEKRKTSFVPILERDAQEQLVKASLRPVYFPVSYVQPETPFLVVGEDLALDPKLFSFLKKTLVLNELTASDEFISHRSDEPLLYVFIPIMKEKTQGVMMMALQIERLIDDIMNVVYSGSKSSDSIAITLTSLKDKPTILLSPKEKIDYFVFKEERMINISEGHQWQLVVHNTTRYLPLDRTEYLVLTLGVLSSLLLAGFIYRKERIRNIVMHEIQNQAGQLSFIMDRAGDAIISINSQGIIESFSPQASKVFGYEQQEVIGENISLLVPSNHKKNHDAYIETYLETGKSNIIRKRRVLSAIRKDGLEIPIELTVTEVRINNKRTFTAFIRDISVKQKRQKILQLISSLQKKFISNMESRTEELFTDITAEIISLVGCDYGFIAKIDHDSTALDQNFIIVGEKHDDEEIIRAFFNGIDITPQTFIYNVNQDNAPSHIRNYLITPIHYGEYLLGVIALVNHPSQFTKEEADELKPLLGTLGSIITAHNARNAQIQIQTILEQTQARFDRAISGSADGIWDWNIITDEVFFSPHVRSMLGYNESEFPNEMESLYKHMHPNDISHAREAMQKHLIDSQPYDIMFRLKTKLGSYCWYRAKGQLLNEGGEYKHISGSLSDVNYIKEQEQKLVEQQHILQIAERIAQIGNWKVDLISGEIYWSNEVYRIHGLSTKIPLLGLDKAVEFYHPEDKDAVENCVAQAINNKTPFNFIKRLIAADGKEKIVESFGKPEMDENGKVISIIGTFEDITDEVNEKEQLLRLSEVAQTTNNGMIVCNTEGQVEWVNNGFENMTGYILPEIYGRTPGSFLQGKDTNPETIRFISKKIANLESFEVDILNYRKDGEELWLNIIFSPLYNSKGEFSGFVASETDITKRKKSEIELKRHKDDLEEMVQEQYQDLIVAKEEAERLNQLKSEFLANMSHELRTPIHAIMSFSRIGKERVDKWDGEKQRNNLDKITTSAQRLSKLLNDLLDLSKLEEGKSELFLSNVDMITMIKQAHSEIESLLGTRKLNLDFNNQERVITECDESKIYQVMMNLLSNAIKFTPEDKSIGIACHSSDDSVEIVVEDQGVGIPDDELESVFDKFIQSSKTKTGAGGTGLGLSICKEIINYHHGTIFAKNSESGGAEFHFKIPKKFAGNA